MALDTVQDYIDRARVLLLDEVEPYRYSTADLIENLNMGILEARRLRPELFLADFSAPLPEFTTAMLGSAVPIDPQCRVSFVYYIAGQAHLRDEENTQDSRAAAFLGKFAAQMLLIQS
jgi:hypothetical protein